MPQSFDDVGECVEAVIRRVGSEIVLALPLGIGKPNPFVNEIYRRVTRDPALRLTIVTALSLARPRVTGDLQRRFLQPIVDRIFGDYPELEYVLAQRRGELPANVRVIEFYVDAGAWLTTASVQRNYLSSNYTHVARDVLARGVNVIAQLVARRPGNGGELSLGSNPDVTLDLLDLAREAGRQIVLVGEIHAAMPFMPGSATIRADEFDYLLAHERYDHDLYAPPNLALTTVDHAIAMHASAWVRDGGTLQIGIGELGDALCYALLLRHQQNAAWRAALGGLASAPRGAADDSHVLRGPFAAGLHACSEMLVDQMLDLIRAGVLRRRVYDSLPIMRALANGRITERFDGRVLDELLAAGLPCRLDERTFANLRDLGVFRSDVIFASDTLRTPDGLVIRADLGDDDSRASIVEHCLGRELRGGKLVQAAFFVGPRGFYAALRDMPESELRQIDMRSVAFVNQLDGPDRELRILQRRHARFVNTTMMITLLGAAVSDALEDGRVVSGVGGQYNFVAMAHALPEARSLLCVRATREKRGRVTSNIVWNYGHTTIPRHLRDIVVTEYGSADLRGRTDEEVVAALLNICDSRFQDGLLARAKAAGKIAASYEIPAVHRSNTPERIAAALATHRREGRFTDYPFGTDLTGDEIVLARALGHLQAEASHARGRLRALLGMIAASPEAADHALYMRMGLERPRDLRGHAVRRLVAWGLRRARETAQ